MILATTLVTARLELRRSTPEQLRALMAGSAEFTRQFGLSVTDGYLEFPGALERGVLLCAHRGACHLASGVFLGIRAGTGRVALVDVYRIARQHRPFHRRSRHCTIARSLTGGRFWQVPFGERLRKGELLKNPPIIQHSGAVASATEEQQS